MIVKSCSDSDIEPVRLSALQRVIYHSQFGRTKNLQSVNVIEIVSYFQVFVKYLLVHTRI